MKKSPALVLLALSLTVSAAHAKGVSAEIFSAEIAVTCVTPALTITLTPRVPRLGEKVNVFEQSGHHFVQAMVSAEIVDRQTKQTVANLTLADVTDPWESAWPVYQSEEFSFYSQDPGTPTRLEFRGADLSRDAQCSFRSLR